MWTIEEVKTRGREAFKRNYWPSVGAAFVLALVTMGGAFASSSQTTTQTQTMTDGSVETVSSSAESVSGSMSSSEMAVVIAVVLGILAIAFAIGFVIKAFVYNPVQVGCYRFFRKNINDPSTKLGTITEGFSNFGHVVITMLFRDLFVALWTLLLIIPGIMKAYAYMLVPYIVKDNPELAPKQVLALSERMMMGNKGQAFLLDLSFIGWLLVGMLTLNLGNIFWTFPYRESTRAALYERLLQNA